MADAMSQDSDTGLTAEQLDAKYGESQDAARTPPKDDEDDTPAWIDEAAAILNKPAGPPANNPPAAAPGAMAAALLPIRSESSQLVEQMGAAAVSAPSAAPPDNGLTGPSKTAAAGGKPGGEDDDTSADDSEEEDTRTEEEKEKDKLAEDIAAEIARVEGAGYTFSKVTKWGAVAAYLDAKDLFEADGLDITDCANEKKRIVETAVRAKITELRAAEEEKRKAPLVVSNGDASQFDFGSEGEGEGEEEEEVEVPLPLSHSPTMYSYPYILCTPIPNLTRRATTKITASTTWRNSTSRSPRPRRCSRWLRRRKRSAR